VGGTLAAVAYTLLGAAPVPLELSVLLGL